MIPRLAVARSAPAVPVPPVHERTGMQAGAPAKSYPRREARPKKASIR